MSTMKRLATLAAFLLFTSLLPMCGGNGGDGAGVTTAPSSTTGSGGSGSPSGGDGSSSVLRFQLTDKPAEQFQAVNVTVASVRVHQSAAAGERDGGWTEFAVAAAMPVDLLKLRNGVLYELCQAQLAAGHYQQVRLVLTPNSGTAGPYNQSVVTADGVSHPLEVPSDSVKIVHSFSVEASTTTDVTLDFDASQSVRQRGNGAWFMQPVIGAVSSTKRARG
jgi:hypothetical protein